MCNNECLKFAQLYLFQNEIKDRKIIEVGSHNVNGSLRSFVEKFHPSKYLGVDILKGPGVDMICDINDLVSCFGRDHFDVVICTEVLEHLLDWRNGIWNLKNVLKPHGILLMTTRSKGFGYHGYPHDFWRFEVEDVYDVFSDFSIEVVQKDPSSPGVFFKGKKPDPFIASTDGELELYSVITSRRCQNIRKMDLIFFRIIWPLRNFISRILPFPIKKIIKKAMRESAIGPIG